MNAARQAQRPCSCGGSCGRCGGNRRKLPDSVRDVVATPGQPLDATTRSRFEPRFGHDFSRVRVHQDSAAASSAGEVRAQAYTVGRDIAFAPGRYQPGTPLGDAILAHELAHVVQQDGRSEEVATLGDDSSSPALEADANRSAQIAAKSLWRRDQKSAFGNAAPSLRTAARLSFANCDPDQQKAAEEFEEEAEEAAQTREPAPTRPVEEEPATPPPDPMGFVLEGATKTPWRVKYKTKKEADAQRDRVRKLHIKVGESVQGSDQQWSFDYWPLTKAEAEAAKAKQEKALGPKYDVTVKESKHAKSWYLEVLKKCPEGMPDKAGFTKWEKCFATEESANALVKKMKDVHVAAESTKVDEGRWGVYFDPMTAAEAKTAGDAAAGKRGGFAEGMYKVTTSEKPELKTHTYSMTTSCPKGWTEVGSSFLITAYALAQESEFPATPTVTDPCGLKGTFRETFLTQTDKAPRGVKMQGSGRALNGDIIHYAGSNCFEVLSQVTTASGTAAEAGRTVAVDKSQIPLGTKLLIEDVGPRTAEDTGGMIGKNHIDVYFGTEKTIAEASAFRMTGKKVCKKT